ncbi:GNAT family N-acetyltransferase [Deinococcus yavapaiensis]|uniref:GNAT family N-acetyltransferase n=1 Tax=Deinococcus yavapaiensis TaxID=309889 RepID=UPI0014766AF2|nr:GNAT family N-acetyltransferase [Deinococcus yavapaiensis]
MTNSPTSLTVHVASPSDVPRIEALIGACGLHLATRGHRNWLPPYPLDFVRRDQERGEAFVALLDGELVGTFALTALGGEVPWREPSAPALYLHRLAVEPALQGRGWGQALLQAAQEEARARGAAWLRLDAYEDNVFLARFYAAAGYEARGRVRIDIGREDLPVLKLICMERALSR